MASVKFQPRGRNGRIPFSLYAPLRVTDEKPLFKVLANDAVPQGYPGVTKDQQIGYWNEQPRWRMRRGERVELPSNWHFYYHGTGPHADVPYRKRTPGVFWVAHGGAKASATGLPTRKSSEKPIEPEFKTDLPNNIEIVEPTTPQASRPNSRSRSRGPQSRDQSSSRNDSQNRNKSQFRNSNKQNQNQSRNQSKSRNQSSDRSNSKEDLIDAVKEALKSLGIGQNHPQKRQNDNQSGSRTPKNKSRSNSKQRDPDNKPEWRKTPTDNIEACFGPRGGFRNFGDSEMMQKGVNASGYAQIASLTPSSAAILFGGNVQTRQLADEVEITYTYKMNVPKDNPALALFIEQVDAYKNGTPKEQRVKKQKRSKSPAPPPLPNQTDGDEGEQESHYENVSDVLPPGAQVEIINEVYDDASSVRQQS
uniref:Nucleoprotein n=1 Tax=Bat alphacoronavirus TaxID=2419667 RepID=A0A5J6DDV3_9ALPC|nr:nucleocapsid protein [Bat alphacoronavirus]